MLRKNIALNDLLYAHTIKIVLYIYCILGKCRKRWFYANEHEYGYGRSPVGKIQARKEEYLKKTSGIVTR